MKNWFAIGELAQRTGCTVDTIRYYERKKLLPLVMRPSGDHRLYTEASVRHVAFVRNAREFGFTLEETAILLNLIEQQPSCGQGAQIMRTHADRIQNRIKELRKVEKRLRILADDCNRCTGCACAIKKTLTDRANPR